MSEPIITDEREAIRTALIELLERIAAKRIEIRSWDNYGKETFQYFDSYNLGLTTAQAMLGGFISTLE